MRYLQTLLRHLLDLPFSIRLTIVACNVLFFTVGLVMLPKQFQNPLVLVIPVVLAAWMFRRSGAFASIAAILVMTWICFVSAPHGTLFFWSPTQAVYYLIGAISLLIIGFMISFQRDSLERSDDAKEQLAIAYEQQQHLTKIKDQFLQNVNHELRTPLTAVYGYLDLLLEHNDQLDSAMRVTFLKQAMYSCDELQLLVNNVLDSIRVDNEKEYLNIEELAVIDIVKEVLERSDPRRLQEHSIAVNVPEYLVVRANAQYTRQVLRNLLSNAFKYAPIDTPIEISAGLYGTIVDSSHPSPEICIRVKDAGPGIPQEQIPLLFGQFVRLQRDISGHVRGTGLGLYISKQFIEAMKGRIWVESTGIPGEGSCFCFTLPCVPRPKIQAKEKNVASPTVVQVQAMGSHPEQPSKTDATV
ncbi:MAG TPA: HAMP domain-containing sensor histidine kinase [Ktedonobacteraceae bacterium]|nr:HAMP domain-containing sensor histidine kinase [Ktedonobacteraceae bacterium]